MNSHQPIAVAGAGSIGCFVGGMLAAAGYRVALLARSRVIGEIKANGLRLTSFDGFDRRIAANALALSEDPSILGDAALVLVTVKSADTADMADTIASHAPRDATIVSFAKRRRQCRDAARAACRAAGVGRNGAVQCSRAWRRPLSSLDLG